MKIIIDKYLQLLKDNVTEFSLSDFYEIFKVSLCAREVQFCTNQKQFLSTFHKCYVCSYYKKYDIRFYLTNHTLTLFKVLKVLSFFAKIESHKKIFNQMFEKLIKNDDKFILINLYFQFCISIERYENRSYRPKELAIFLKNTKKGLGSVIDNVSKNTSLEYFFMTGIPTTTWDTFQANFYEITETKKFKINKAYWKRYTNFQKAFVIIRVKEEIKIIDKNEENLIALSTIIFNMIPIERTKITIASDYFLE